MGVPASIIAVRDNLIALGPRRLSILGIAGLVVFGAIGLGSFMLSKSRFVPVYVGLTTHDSGRIAAALESVAVPFDVSADGAQVSVAPENLHRARALLAERGLPASGAAGYELFDKIGPLGLTSFMQEVTRVRVLEGEIARTIQSMQGVRSARVHIAMGETGGFRRASQPASASVVIRFDLADPGQKVQAIRHLVAAAIPGASIENIRVLSADGAVLAAGGDESLAGSTRMVELERIVSRQLQNNINLTLAPHLGRENFETSVAVRLNVDKKQVSESVFDPESKVERSVRVTKETGSAQNGGNKTATGVEQNLPGAQDGAGGPSQSQKSNQRRDEVTNYEISSKATTTTSDGYRVEGVTVAVVINKRKLMQPNGQPLDEPQLMQRIAEIEKIVSAAAGLDTKRGDRVTVSAQEFMLDGASAPSEGEGFMGVLGRYASSLMTAALVVVVTMLIVWFGLRPLARSLADIPQPALAEIAAPAVTGPGGFEANIAPMLSDGGMGMPQSMSAFDGMSDVPQMPADRLNQLVGLDSERARSVLRRWLSEERMQQ